jgi:hypothetical protein
MTSKGIYGLTKKGNYRKSYQSEYYRADLLARMLVAAYVVDPSNVQRFWQNYTPPRR